MKAQTHHSEDPAVIEQQRPRKRTRKSSRATSRSFIDSDTEERQEEVVNDNVNINNDDPVNADQVDQYQLPFTADQYADTHLNVDTHQQPLVEQYET